MDREIALQDLSLKHKGLLHDRLKKVPVSLSEYSFANLYLFRKAHGYQLCVDGQDIFVVGKTYDGQRFVMPTAKPVPEGMNKLLGLARDYDFIFPLAEEWLTLFEGYDIETSFLDGDSDYIYTVEILETYQGQKLHSKKNLLNQFLSLYTPKPKPLTLERMADALDILETWQVDVGEGKENTDYYPCRESFGLYEELGLCGGIYYVNSEPAGFIIGEELNEEMFALHFAKGKRKFKGMYQYMYNHFAKILPGKYRYLNFEQDLGKLALKIAKSSYSPDFMAKKYRLKVT